HTTLTLGTKQVVDALMSRKVEVDAKDLMGRTALHHAAKHGEVETCRRVWTLSSKIDPSCLTDHQRSQHDGQQQLESFHPMLHYLDRQLLEYNATLNAKDTVGCTPLHMAAR
ncbi:unnamed protein product, partial [Hapterophycus canaliculatus]